MMKRAIWIAMVLAVLGCVSASYALADEWDKKTILTFSQPVEIPGHILPAGTYTFKLLDSPSDRHIVQVFNADGSRIIATVMAISNSRLTATDKTVITFGEVPTGSPETIRAWFYPGNTIGQEFVYPKPRAVQLAKASKAPVPAIAVDVASIEDIKTVEIVAIAPDDQEIIPVSKLPTVASGSSSVVGTTGVKPARQNARQLPKTAGASPLVLLLGLVSAAGAFGLMVYGRYRTASAV